jgi:parvulin-like peptidyl-prolyl isomerase
LIEYLKQLSRVSNFEQFKELGRLKFEEALTAKMKDMLLYQEARRHIGEVADEALEKAVDSEWRRYVVRFGGDEAKAEEALRKMGMNRKSFREQAKKAVIRQSYLASKFPGRRPVTRRELMECYEEMKEEYFAVSATLKFRLIDIQPAKLEMTGGNQDRLGRARELAKGLVKRIRDGEDFGELAKQYSDGHRSMFGGLWDPVQPESLAEPYNVLVAEAEKIAPGWISVPIEVEGHIFIMKLEEKRLQGYEPLENVQEYVEQRVIAKRQKEAFDKFDAELMRQVALSERDKFIDFCLEKTYQTSTQ